MVIFLKIYLIELIIMNLIFNKIREILNKSYSIKFDQIELETNFEIELGFDSREFFELINDFENTFNIDIFLDDIDEIRTIKEAVIYIEKKIADSNNLENTVF